METEFDAMFDQINFSLARFIEDRYNPEAAVKERFITWWTSFATHCIKRPFDFSYMDQLATSHLYHKFGEQPSTAFYGETRSIIMQGQADGIIKEGNISQIIQFIRCAITAVIKTHISSGKTLSTEHINWMIQTCWDGIKK